MRINTIVMGVTALSTILAFVGTPASAAALIPGQTAFATGEPGPVGATVVATQTLPFATALYSGTLTSTVYANDVLNPFGGLTFEYQVTNLAGTNPITRFTAIDFAGYLTDVSFNAAIGSLSPTLVTRSPVAGGTIGFDFIGAPVGTGQLTQGTASMGLVVQTDALGFVSSFGSVIDGTTSSVPIYAPILIPEPTSLSILALAACTFRRRR